MNVYKRPLFMQQGGMARVPVPTPPAAMRPAAAPQGAMPPMRPAAAPPARPTGQAAGIASMVSDKSKMDIDQAQGPEQIINAFRGNQKPIAARYQELAQYVGPQDATSTPVSVLTMVQPALMMTAKGAADSGIGELMANVAGKVNMESAPGQANRMGQGLGNIMMSRQAPQPAGMAQGGVVGKFQDGGNPLVEYYKQDLPAFQEILAPSQGDKDAAKRQLFFDIAQRGLAMAGGAGGTGNVASQLANVFQTLPGTYAAQQAELRKGERAAQQAALQSAAGRVGADREQAAKLAELNLEARLKREEQNTKFIYDLTLARDKAMNERVPFDGLAVYGSDGTQLTILNQNSPTFDADLASIKDANPNAQIAKIPDQKDLFPGVEVPELTPSQVEGVFTDRGLLDKISAGNATPQELTRLNAAIAAKTNPKPVGTGTIGPDGLEIFRNVSGQRLPEEWNDAIQQARQGGLNVQLPPYLSQPQPGAGEQGQANPLFADYDVQVGTGQPLSLTEIQSVELPSLGEQPSGIESAVMEYPIERMFGTWAALDRTWNTYAPAVLGLLGPEAAAAAAPEQPEANAEQGLAAFHTLVVESMLAARPGRASDETRRILTELLPTLNAATSSQPDALGKYQALQGEMATDLRRVEGFLQQPLSQADRQKYDFIRRELNDRLGELNTIVTQLKNSTPGGKRTPPARFDEIMFENTRVPYTPDAQGNR